MMNQNQNLRGHVSEFIHENCFIEFRIDKISENRKALYILKTLSHIINYFKIRPYMHGRC